ncbi:MAG: hypothetical protein ACREON_15705 [Gemmatimonadaceae bacterium]
MLFSLSSAGDSELPLKSLNLPTSLLAVLTHRCRKDTDQPMAEELFRYHVLRLLKAQGLLSNERIELLVPGKAPGSTSMIPFASTQAKGKLSNTSLATCFARP